LSLARQPASRAARAARRQPQRGRRREKSRKKARRASSTEAVRIGIVHRIVSGVVVRGIGLNHERIELKNWPVVGRSSALATCRISGRVGSVFAVSNEFTSVPTLSQLDRSRILNMIATMLAARKTP
jgi:hypothetical protein